MAKGNRKKTGKGSSSRKTATKKRDVTQEFADEQPKKGAAMGDEVAITATFLVSALLFLSNLGFCGFIGEILRSAQLGLFGALGFFFPFLLMGAVLFLLTHVGAPGARRRMTAAFFLLVFLTAAVHLLFAGVEGKQLLEFYQEAGEGMINGGLVGGALAMLLYGFCGQAGSLLILLALIVLCLVFITEKPFVKRFTMGSLHAAGKATDRAKEDFREFSKTAKTRREEARKKRQAERRSDDAGRGGEGARKHASRHAQTPLGVDFAAIDLSQSEEKEVDAPETPEISSEAEEAALSPGSPDARKGGRKGTNVPLESDADSGDAGDGDIEEVLLEDPGDVDFEDFWDDQENQEDPADQEHLDNLVREIELPLNTRHKDATLTEEELAYRMSVLYGEGKGTTPRHKGSRRQRRRGTSGMPVGAEASEAGASVIRHPAALARDMASETDSSEDVARTKARRYLEGRGTIPAEEETERKERAGEGAVQDAASVFRGNITGGSFGDPAQEGSAYDADDQQVINEGNGRSSGSNEDEGIDGENRGENRGIVNGAEEGDAWHGWDDGQRDGALEDVGQDGIDDAEGSDDGVDDIDAALDAFSGGSEEDDLSDSLPDPKAYSSSLADRLGLASSATGGGASAGQIERLLGYEEGGERDGIDEAIGDEEDEEGEDWFAQEDTEGAEDIDGVEEEEIFLREEENLPESRQEGTAEAAFSLPSGVRSPSGSRTILTSSGQRIQAVVEPVRKQTEEERRESSRRAAEDRALAEAKLQQEMQEKQKKKRKPYQFPSLSLLARGGSQDGDSREEIQENAIILQQTLKSFGIGVTVTNVSVGPSVTRYELMPEQGIKLSRIVALTNDIKMRLAAADIRMEAPIPGKSAVGIEVPNKKSQTVFLGDIFGSEEFQKSKGRIVFGVGKDIAGKTVVTDIAKMPHLLIAGATGAGKSVSINTIIMSILYKYGPEDVRLIMVDPKVVELQVYNGIPHLLIPVVTDPKKAAAALNWAVQEMTDRYKKFAETGSRDLKGYNDKIDAVRRDPSVPEEDKPERLPQIVIIIDELADLMMVSAQEVEDAICRIAQLARACGMHLVIATQRPSVNVITGLIKANIPSRIAFAVSSGTDSRTILDMVGAEKLLGKGDMLFFPSGIPKPIRVQGAFVSDEEVQAVTDYLRETGEAEYNDAVKSSMDNPGTASKEEEGGGSYDQLFRESALIIISTEKASIGMLQRKFRIGFNRAARIMDQLSEAGVVGPEEGTKPRKVLMSLEEFQQAFPEG